LTIAQVALYKEILQLIDTPKQIQESHI